MEGWVLLAVVVDIVVLIAFLYLVTQVGAIAKDVAKIRRKLEGSIIDAPVEGDEPVHSHHFPATDVAMLAHLTADHGYQWNHEGGLLRAC